MEIKTKVERKIEAAMNLTGGDVLGLVKALKDGKIRKELRKQFNTHLKGVEVPDNANVTFHVPTGGDYSGMDVDVNQDNPVTVMFANDSDKAS